MLFSWVNSARPQSFMDSYYAHYKAKRRYWPGLLLVLCFVLFMFALNPQQHSSVNWQLEFFNCGPGSGVGFTGLDALAGSFALNLITLPAVTSRYVSQSKGNQLAVCYTSISTALARKKSNRNSHRKFSE